MGTRSLLAVETRKGRCHVQYMQFDGYPSVKGYDYYTGILKALPEGRFWNGKGKPSAHFTKLCLHFLNYYQYASGHSIGNHWIIDTQEWEKQDSGAEWQYLFKDGDFMITPFSYKYAKDYSSKKRLKTPTYIIPWELTHAIAANFHSLMEFENKKEVQVGEYIRNLDFFQRFLTKVETALRDETETYPILILEEHEVLAFSEQGEHGWRKAAKVYISDDPADCIYSMFSGEAYKDLSTRNTTKYESRVIDLVEKKVPENA